LSAVKKSIVVEQLRKAQLLELLSKGGRLDGRGLLDYRPITVKTHVIEKAEGSARVSLGNTQVIAGVKVELGEPFPDTPDKGLLIVNAEVLPLASPYAEPGPPDEDAIELARVVDRGVRESQMINLSELALLPGKRVYAVFVDVSILNVDGNLFDATSYSVVAALLTSHMTKYAVIDGEARKTDETSPLPIQTIPVSVTMARVGDAIIADPTSEEEAVMDARITLTSDGRGNFCAGQKGQSGTLTFEQVRFAAQTSRVKGEEIRELLRRSVESAKV